MVLSLLGLLAHMTGMQCQQNMASALTSENALSIEYDESTMCDVCKDVSL